MSTPLDPPSYPRQRGGKFGGRTRGYHHHGGSGRSGAPYRGGGGQGPLHPHGHQGPPGGGPQLQHQQHQQPYPHSAVYGGPHGGPDPESMPPPTIGGPAQGGPHHMQRAAGGPQLQQQQPLPPHHMLGGPPQQGFMRGRGGQQQQLPATDGHQQQQQPVTHPYDPHHMQQQQQAAAAAMMHGGGRVAPMLLGPAAGAAAAPGPLGEGPGGPHHGGPPPRFDGPHHPSEALQQQHQQQQQQLLLLQVRDMQEQGAERVGPPHPMHIDPHHHHPYGRGGPPGVGEAALQQQQHHHVGGPHGAAAAAAAAAGYRYDAVPLVAGAYGTPLAVYPAYGDMWGGPSGALQHRPQQHPLQQAGPRKKNALEIRDPKTGPAAAKAPATPAAAVAAPGQYSISELVGLFKALRPHIEPPDWRFCCGDTEEMRRQSGSFGSSSNNNNSSSSSGLGGLRDWQRRSGPTAASSSSSGSSSSSNIVNGLGAGLFGGVRRPGTGAAAGGSSTNSSSSSSSNNAFRSLRGPGELDGGDRQGDSRLNAPGSAAAGALSWRGGGGAGAPRGPLAVNRGPPTDGYTKLSGFFGNRPPPPTREPPAQQSSMSRLSTSTGFRVGREIDPRERKRRSLNALLNKLTIDNFGVVCEKICLEAEQFDSVADLELLSDLLFNKAVSEPEYSEMYADLYQIIRWRSPDFTVPGEERKINFHRTFVNRCQDEFERLQGKNVLLITEEERAECQDADDEAKLLKKKKTRVLGNMRFIGELFLRRALSPNVLNDVVHALVFSSKGDAFPDEHFIECLTELLTTIGYTMDSQDSSRAMMNEFIGKLQELQLRAGYSSRITFKIQDLLDLRQRHWTKKVFRDVAKSVAQIREDAKRDELMGGAIKVAQDGVFLTVGLRREMPYKSYLEEQRVLLSNKRAAAAASGEATTATANSKRPTPTTKTTVTRTPGSSSSSGTPAFSRSSVVSPAAAVLSAPVAAAAAGSSSSKASAATEVSRPYEAQVMKKEVDLLTFEFVVEKCPIESSLSEFVSLSLPLHDSAAQISAVFKKGLGDSRPADSARYAVLIGSLAAEHLKATADLQVLFDYFGDVLIGQLSDFVVDNPRALAMCAEAFGVLFAADIWAAKGAELIRKGLRVPLPDEEGLAVKMCQDIARQVSAQSPERKRQLQELLELTLAQGLPGCSPAAAASLLRD
ncbi:hypothetical protein ETH_00011725 [Eimeria tenella]|uniref:MIF4G domain-containing protein n=1 Tax=Eimeria tenella TaxID=5802 RepID=U6L0H3_EIMTE|nr:hypothetical protein ETH_00011725 [Eimeria tenella]CDJ41260.1 hypothetical protein ETH_00011725 [Eimeria tenella]|eukprot:XP_013232010.1 hypothetical protein ETH_00011725 [Eimeria tenella]